MFFLFFYSSTENPPQMPRLKAKSSAYFRRLTISSKYRRRPNLRDCIIPELRLCGAWLEQAGFKPGGQVKVEVHKNQLIIKKQRR